MDQLNDYQFVMIPQQLASCLDANCGKMLTTLLGLSSLMKKEDGWFYRSNKELQLDTRFSQNLVIATLDTLYQAGIINVDCIGKGRGHRSNRIHINFESFKAYQQYSFNDIRNNPDLWIETVPYKNHYSPSYCKERGKERGKGIGNTIGKGIGKKVTTNTDTTDTSNTSDTKEYNIINIENILDKDKISNKENIDNTPTCKIIEEEKKDIYSSKVNINNDTKEIVYSCFNNFINKYKNLDYQLLLDKSEEFLKINEIKLGTLSQSITSKTGIFFSKEKTNRLLEEYINSQLQEIRKPA